MCHEFTCTRKYENTSKLFFERNLFIYEISTFDIYDNDKFLYIDIQYICTWAFPKT